MGLASRWTPGLVLIVCGLVLGACGQSGESAPAPRPPAPPAAVRASTSQATSEARVSSDPDDPPAYVLTGDLAELKKKGIIRLLVTTPDHLARAGDPKIDEEALALAFARKLNLRAVSIVVSDRSALIPALNAGKGDVIVASLAITPERSREIAFTRPIRFVKQQVVVRKTDQRVRRLADLAGKTVTVRPSSSYAATLKGLARKVKDIRIKPARETEDTLDLIQKVARGEEAITVADSDIVAAARTFEPDARVAFNLTERDPIAWGVRRGNPALKAALDAFLVERALTAHKERTQQGDLDAIRKRGVLRVLTRNTSTTYFIYHGEELGFEYELARAFAKELGVRLEMIVPPSREALTAYLKAGRGDLVAAGLTVTPDRRREFVFSTPYNQVSELLIVPAKDTSTRGLADLRGKKIVVRRSSSYFQSLMALRGTNGFEIQLAPEEQETEDLLEEVGEGKHAATVADSNIVDVELTYSEKIRSVGPIGAVRDIAWIFRKDEPKLRAAADRFIAKIYKGTFYNMTVAKYFKDRRQMRLAASDDRADRAGRLSPYDPLTKKYAGAYQFDWRLVTSQMYQESRFDPRAKSWAGALGLMQVMPKTARELGVANVLEPEQGIQAGVKLLARYAELFHDPLISEEARLQFALAAYNCGPGHVADGRRLAADLKLDPNRWARNVEQAMPLLAKPRFARKTRYGYCRCGEPVRYVAEIQSRYASYSSLIALN